MKITLKAARINAGFKQEDAAKELKRNKKTISYWETGKSFPTAKDISNIEKAYKVSYNDIIFLPNKYD